jgi:hypothetical protein
LARLGWNAFFRQQQQPHSINPRIIHLRHPAAHLLHRVATVGVPHLCHDPPWSTHHKDLVYHRGPHTSATTQHAEFLIEDMYTMSTWAIG